MHVLCCVCQALGKFVTAQLTNSCTCTVVQQSVKYTYIACCSWGLFNYFNCIFFLASDPPIFLKHAHNAHAFFASFITSRRGLRPHSLRVASIAQWTMQAIHYHLGDCSWVTLPGYSADLVCADVGHCHSLACTYT